MSTELDLIALDKRIGQARERVASPATTDSRWTIQLLDYLADEAEAALAELKRHAPATVGGLCEATAPSPVTGHPLHCTLVAGHPGVHAAEGISGVIHHAWFPEVTP